MAVVVLTAGEEMLLSNLEGVVERGMATFVEVGGALAEIRDRRLYRQTHSTFEDYCAERWGMTRQHAHRTVEAAQVAGVLSPMGDTPRSERVARELAPLRDAPEKMREAWAEAVERHGPEPTAKQVAEVVKPRLGVHFSSDSDEWATPQAFFDALHREFGFELDVCALPASAKCERYFSPEDDGLAQRWTGVCWMNPPYGEEIPRWVAKAHRSAGEGATVVALVPARVDTGWWWDYCRHHEIRFLRGRLKFGGSPNSAPFPSAVVVFGAAAGVVWWEPEGVLRVAA